MTTFNKNLKNKVYGKFNNPTEVLNNIKKNIPGSENINEEETKDYHTDVK